MRESHPTNGCAGDASKVIDARDALRRATADLHGQVDVAVPLAKAAPTLRDYRDHLQLLDDWIRALRALPVDVSRLDAQAAALREDIMGCNRLLGEAPLACGAAVFPAGRVQVGAFGWGVAYVIEGSQLGGQLLYRRLRERLAPHPLAYLNGQWRGTGGDWSRFLGDLRANVVCTEELDEACAGAVEAFELLLQCLRLPRASP